ncbi:hypothetical protein PK98_01785 [Croceibacterium mercuriale]|uniref:Uncharacterized protein n=1 Tax=Croceibacterium mercuriale TaxID=1572751 RepID=A0A0B2C0D4_9SPHN|nr:hypothetical protein [Croceibacterium mercuriale]KHL25456.1 hypothetical protein PK98_01785 [Croceibacterium mercuriale]
MRPARTRIIPAAIAASLVLLGAMLWIMGSAVVIDRSGNVLSAAITGSGGTTQPLHHLPGRIFYTMPRVEGAIELRCRDGARGRWSYVTRHMHSWLRVGPGAGCGRVVQLR